MFSKSEKVFFGLSALTVVISALTLWVAVEHEQEHRGDMRTQIGVIVVALIYLVGGGYVIYRNLRDANRAERQSGELSQLRSKLSSCDSAASELTILQATWGNEFNRPAVDEIVSRKPRNGLVFYVCNDAFPGIRDPAPGANPIKYVEIEYRYPGTSAATIRRKEGEWVVLPEDLWLKGEIKRLTDDRPLSNEAIAREYEKRCTAEKNTLSKRIEELETELADQRKARRYPYSVFTFQDSDVSNSPPHVPGLEKTTVTLTNGTGNEIEVWSPIWRSSSGVQLYMGMRPMIQLEHTDDLNNTKVGWRHDLWYEESSVLTVKPGFTFRCWIGLFQPRGEGIARRLKMKNTGTAIFPVKIEGALYEVPIDL